MFMSPTQTAGSAPPGGTAPSAGRHRTPDSGIAVRHVAAVPSTPAGPADLPTVQLPLPVRVAAHRAPEPSPEAPDPSAAEAARPSAGEAAPPSPAEAPGPPAVTTETAPPPPVWPPVPLVHAVPEIPPVAPAWAGGPEAGEAGEAGPPRFGMLWLQADALYQAAGIHLELGRPDEAVTALDSAEALYSQLGTAGADALADTRARRARAHARLGRGLSALVDVQAAVVHHSRRADGDPSGVRDGDPGGGTTGDRGGSPVDRDGDAAGQATRRSLAAALAGAAAVQAEFGDSHLALAAARRAEELLGDLDRSVTARTGTPADDEEPARADLPRALRLDRVTALQVQIRMLLDLGRGDDVDGPARTLAGLVGDRQVLDLLAADPRTPRPGLADAAGHELVEPEVRAEVDQLLADTADGATVPGLLVAPERLLDAAREGAATALALAPHDLHLALAAGREAACLYACAEDLGLIEHPWPLVRVELARWLWLLSELGWLACSAGELDLARDLAAHAQHPLTRAECGRHLPTSIARSLNESGVRLRDLRRAVA